MEKIKNPARLKELKTLLRRFGNPHRAKISASFFKTGQGEYGEGDVFLGVTVREMRSVAKSHQDISFSEIRRLLASRIHEERFVALEILVMKYERGDMEEKEKSVNFYLRNTKGINNWDLVDTSAPYLLGNYLWELQLKEHSHILKNVRMFGGGILERLAKSNNVWERRIAIVASYAFIKNGEYNPTLKIAKILINDNHDLIRKARGWMLREVGKLNLKLMEGFLKRHYRLMPRTMLRYAIERLPEKRRQKYLRGVVA